MTSQENMDEEERMELALNSDFDSALLACWEKSPKHDNIDDEVDEHFNGRRIDHSERSAPSGGHRDAGNWDAPAASDRFFRLPSFTMEDEAFYQRSTAPASQAMPQAHQQNQSNLQAEASSDSGSSNAVNNVSASDTGSVSLNRDQQTIPTLQKSHSKDPSNVGSSSASSIGQASSSLASHQTEGPQQSMEPKQLRTESPNSPVQLHPLAFQASANCPPHLPNAAPAPSIYPTQPELMPLAYNAMAAGMSFANPMLFQPQMQAPSIRLPEMHAAPPLPPPPPIKKSRRKGKGKATTAKAAKAAAANAPPPFLLFDAPVELRANFMIAQRSHGMPTMQDNNAYHYGMAVNGFHPQDHLNPSNPSTRAVSEGGGSSMSNNTNNTVRLIDGRHGNQGMKRLKNVKEQKRAQRITDLIEQLREKMEQDGWNVGMKSKFHTLSSCADYVKHLTAINKEKEEAVKKAQCDLEATKRKLEGEKDERDASEPESVTSGLTDSSGLASTKAAAKAGVEEQAEANNISHKRPRPASHASFISSSMSSSGDDSGNQMPDLTDSNIASSSSGNEEVEDDSPSFSSVSSNADVKKIQGVTSIRSREAGHADVVIQNKRKRKTPPAHAEATSLEGNFELDYEEVFLNSNVPQVLATTSGKVVAWNDFFLRVTGFSKRDMQHLTIFSLVQSSDLSSVFEIVAAALRTNALPAQEGTRIESSEENIIDTKPSALQWDYEAMTLPCVKFRPLREGPGEKKPKQLNMTLTLMPDEDPRKRCFHGVFTDCAAGTKGSLGTISPELLSLLASQKDEHRPHASSKRKRVKHSIKESKEEFPCSM